MAIDVVGSFMHFPQVPRVTAAGMPWTAAEARNALDLLHLMALFSHFCIRHVAASKRPMAPATDGRHTTSLA